jgi:hypothetical protein
MLDEHLQLGDSRAACVISIAPLVVAAYTDELDCIALLNFPAWLVEDHALKTGGRLITVNTYMRGSCVVPDLAPGPRQLRRYINFYPVIAEFFSDNVQRIAARKAEIAEEEWARCQQMGGEYLQRHPNHWRNGSPFWSAQPVISPSTAPEDRRIEDQALKRPLSSTKIVERPGGSPGSTTPLVLPPKKRPWWKFWG